MIFIYRQRTNKQIRLSSLLVAQIELTDTHADISHWTQSCRSYTLLFHGIGIPDGSQQDIKVNKVEHLFDGFQIEYLYIKHIYIIHMLCNLLSCGMMVLYVDVDGHLNI